MNARPFELWDVETGNAIGAFRSEHEALDAVREALRTHGDEYVRAWGLARATARRMRAIATGDDLITRARAGVPADPASSAAHVAG